MNTKQIHKEWIHIFEKEFSKDYFQKINIEVKNCSSKGLLCPNINNIFKAFEKTKFSELKIEIKIQEISAECYMRMLNRSIYINKRLKGFDEMLIEGLTISLRNACELITGRIEESESLNPILDKAFANEIEMFLEMTKRNVNDNMKLLDLDHFENNEIILLDSD